MNIKAIEGQKQLIWDHTCGPRGSEVIYLHPNSYVHRNCVPDGPANSNTFEWAILNKFMNGVGYGTCRFCDQVIIPSAVPLDYQPTPAESLHFL
jgi:hypothetical protein